ncbi:hypothetical protein BH09MYX1_BH09MYX1_33180 [soil metagenome]
MNRLILTLASAAALSIAAMGCSSTTDTLQGDEWLPAGSTAGGEGNTFDHDNDNPQNPSEGTNPVSGSPLVISKLHSCSKITYTALGKILQSRGVNPAGNTPSANLYKNGQSALGVANYGGRVSEAVIGSTAALSKEFDILVAAAIEIQTAAKGGAWNVPGCPNTQLFDGTGNFTKDGISCVMGKPATPEHVQVANDAITAATGKGLTKDQGQQIALASLLEAAHTCE